MEAIKNYFGEEVAMYFQWIGFYTMFLVPAALVGILCFLYGVTSVNSYTPVKEICQVRFSLFKFFVRDPLN